MNGIQAVVLDLDGTLLNSSRRVSERSLRAVTECHNKGISIIIATARPARSVRILLPDELLQLGCIIYYNGAHTVDAVYKLEDHIRIDQATVSKLYQAILDISPELTVSFEAQGTMYSNRLLRQEHRDLLGFPHGEPQPNVLTLEEIRSLQPAKLLFSNENNLYKELESRFVGRVKVVVTDGNRLVQLMNGAVSKAAALEPVLERRGIRPEQVMVFGDDYNDLELFGLCGYPVAMGNAIAELKSKAVQVTETNDRDGVALVLEALLNQLNEC